MSNSPDKEEPLPATMGFVFTIGVGFAVGWLLLFLMLKDRF
jgi:hypothetical protein